MPSKKFSGILLCSDIDGTLTDSDGKLSDENTEAIAYFQRNGGLFTVATGRRSSFLEKYCKYFVPNTYLITLNGAIITVSDGKTHAADFPLDGGTVDAIGEMVEKYSFLNDIHFHLRDRTVHYSGGNYESFKRLIGEPVYDVVFCQSERDTLLLKKELPAAYKGYSFSRSWPNGIEMYSHEAGKGNAVEFAKKLTHSDISIAVGNYDNDVDMLMSADMSYAVADSNEDALKAAKKITVSCSESALANIIYSL